MLSSEVFPFAKTGGLGDVAGALPRALAKLGAETAVVLPYYRKVKKRNDAVTVVSESVPCRFAGEERPYRLLKGVLPGPEQVPIYFVQNEGVFEVDDDIYGQDPGSYGDGHLRFLYFCEAAIRLPRATGFFPDVFHLNDWQTGAVAPLLRHSWTHDAELDRAATVLTIHNLAYQGVFPRSDLLEAGVPAFLLEEGRMLEKGQGNLLASGLRYADALTTVSRTYAREILGEALGNGLDGLLRWREPILRGIVNGLDTDVWNPSTDKALKATYDEDSIEEKALDKSALLKECKLDPTDGPVFGVVSRYTDQKGLDLVPSVIEAVLAREPKVRFVALGSGDKSLEQSFARIARRFPRRAFAKAGFDEPFSHRIEAGADFFLMPSRFEPCGLNQLISMRYGTPPIVRRTGGLADTVVDATDASIAAGTATGFQFDEDAAEALAKAVERALKLFEKRDDYRSVQRAGMTTDLSWGKSAAEYLELFEEAIERRRGGSEHLADLLEPEIVEPTVAILPPLAAVPDHYPRDVMVAIARDPWTLFCAWELGGPQAIDRLSAIAPARKDGIRYTLRIVDHHTRAVIDTPLGGIAHNWFVTVSPGATYEAELLIEIPDDPPRQILTAGPVTMPPDVHPERA